MRVATSARSVYPRKQTRIRPVQYGCARSVTGDTRPIQAYLRLSFRSAFLRDGSVCFHYWIVESPAGNGAYAIKAGENA